jgi:hypothetical protein
MTANPNQLTLSELERAITTCNRKVNESWCDAERQYWTQRLKQAMGDLERRREREGEEREKNEREEECKP